MSHVFVLDVSFCLRSTRASDPEIGLNDGLEACPMPVQSVWRCETPPTALSLAGRLDRSHSPVDHGSHVDNFGDRVGHQEAVREGEERIVAREKILPADSAAG